MVSSHISNGLDLIDPDHVVAEHGGDGYVIQTDDSKRLPEVCG